MNETLDLIQSLSEERYTLYRLAGKGGLRPDQEQRLNEINGRLPQLWDEYRRDLAASNRPVKPASIPSVTAEDIGAA